MAVNKMNDLSLLEVIDTQLIQPAQHIYNKRKIFLKQLFPLIIQFYNYIANNEEQLTVGFAFEFRRSTFVGR